jgi:hypothetical protein
MKGQTMPIAINVNPQKLLTSRYDCKVFNSILWVGCMECQVDVFEWRSERKFGLDVLDSALRRHEDMWHKPSNG